MSITEEFNKLVHDYIEVSSKQFQQEFFQQSQSAPNEPVNASTDIVSIVFPVSNHELSVANCIESVIRQTRSNWELLLIDDGSTDKTPDICKSYTQKDTRIKYITQQPKGVAISRNTGISYAKGNMIMFLNGDSCYLENALETMQAALIKDSRIKFCFSDYYENNGSTRLLRQTEDPLKKPALLFQLIRYNPIFPSAVIAYKESILEAGGFNPRFEGSEELDLWLRLVLRFEVRRVPVPTVLHYPPKATFDVDKVWKTKLTSDQVCLKFIRSDELIKLFR